MARRRRNPRIRPKTALMVGGLLVAGVALYGWAQAQQQPNPFNYPDLSGSNQSADNWGGTVWSDPLTGAGLPETIHETIMPGLADAWKAAPTAGSQTTIMPGLNWLKPDTGHSGLLGN